MKICIVKAASDLGVHVNGADKGALSFKEIDNLVDNTYEVLKNNEKKELEKENKCKNLKEVNIFNEKLYSVITNTNDFVITIGGDHSISIASILASQYKHKKLGVIWIDAHSDYHTTNTTISGNIHGMPFATISGRNGTILSSFFDKEYISPENCVLIGGRDIEKDEYVNLEKAGVTIFTTNDIKKYGTKKIMEKAFEVASNNTNGIHISYDIDVIDPNIAKGVSVKAKDGINEEEAYDILDEIINRKNLIKSFDLVEYNPTQDIDNKTKEIAVNILTKFIDSLKKGI